VAVGQGYGSYEIVDNFMIDDWLRAKIKVSLSHVSYLKKGCMKTDEVEAWG
jgi:hypothetical protein